MKDKIKQTILSILAEKRRNGDVLPYAMSIEVAHLLHMNAIEVESLAQDIKGIEKGKTINHEWYDIEHRDIQEVSSEQETESEG
jgi:hypothetical protein